MFDLFLLTDWHGNTYPISDKRLRDRVLKDASKSKYDWIASAEELLNTCNKKGFNESYAIDIKAAIMDCFASFLYSGDLPRDIKYAYQAFNELNGNSDDVSKSARYNLLNAFIYRRTLFSYINFSTDDTYYRLREEWRKNKIKELLNESYIDFYELSDSLSKEYNEYMNEQEKKGIIKREGLKLFDSDLEPFYISFKDSDEDIVKEKNLKK